MGKTTQAVDTLDRLAVQLAGITEAAEQLRKIGSVEGAIEALTGQREAIQEDIATARGKLDALQALIVDAEGAAHTIMQQASAEARAQLDQAKADAEQMVREAKDAAAKTLADERAEREKNLASINTQMTHAKTKLDDLQAKTAKTLAEADAAERKRADAQAALDQVKAAAAKLAG